MCTKVCELAASLRSGNVTAKATLFQTSKHKPFCYVCISIDAHCCDAWFNAHGKQPEAHLTMQILQ